VNLAQVIITSAATPPASGQGFAKGQDPESVDANGVENVVKCAIEFLPRSKPTEQVFVEASDFSTWESRDDTLMGGTSSSAISVVEGTSGVLQSFACVSRAMLSEMAMLDVFHEQGRVDLHVCVQWQSGKGSLLWRREGSVASLLRKVMICLPMMVRRLASTVLVLLLQCCDRIQDIQV
jgi:hypothetical protein